jgi:ribosomal protein S12 methylthiotransferase accessory factor
MNRIKPYKEQTPSTTIFNIRTILQEIGIFVTEKFKKNGDFYSCRIEIANDGLEQYHIGTNGKGISLEYAFASAYAEFMERLQNNVLIGNTFFFSKYYNNTCPFNSFLHSIGGKIDFIYDLHEEIIDVEEIVLKNEQQLRSHLFCANKDEIKERLLTIMGSDKLLCVPFYDVNNKREVKLPIDFTLQCTSSTGMCAGNTPEEALVQGFCEILERYAVKEIYYSKLTPPTIPTEYFKNDAIYEKIIKIESQGFKVIIKDFSLGKKLPVIGVIVINPFNRTFNVKAGADPWPIVALERCLTELHQNFDGIRLQEKEDYGFFEQYNSDYEFINLTRILNNSTGQWPESMFLENFSYEFGGLDFSHGTNNTSDLVYLKNLITGLGFQIYIRDVSFLGFPSYYIVVPSMSDDKRGMGDFRVFKDLFVNCSFLMNHISVLLDKDIIRLTSLLEEYYNVFKDNFLNIGKLSFDNTDEDIKNISIDLLLSMLFYYIGQFDKSYIYINEFLKQKPVSEYLYFYACKDYISFRAKTKDLSMINTYLELFYGKELAIEVEEDMKNPHDVFKSYNIQSYFDCRECEIKNFKYINVYKILLTIRKKMMQNNISQINLSSIFN